MVPLIYPGIALLAGAAYLVKRRRDKKAAASGVPATGELTPERQSIYETAMNDEKDPGKIAKVADAFEAQGLPDQADMLRKRAALRGLPADVKAARKKAFKQGMASKNKQGVMNLAAAFQGEGATGSAEALRKYASGLVGKE